MKCCGSRWLLGIKIILTVLKRQVMKSPESGASVPKIHFYVDPLKDKLVIQMSMPLQGLISKDSEA